MALVGRNDVLAQVAAWIASIGAGPTVATVEAHLTRIYAKAGVRSRTELARRVSDGSLVLEGDDDPGAEVASETPHR